MKKIAIVGSEHLDGEGKVTKALIEFLCQKGFEVKYFCYNPDSSRIRMGYYKLIGLGKRMLIGNSERDKYVDNLAKHINSERFDVLIAVGAGDILLRDLNCTKIYFCRGVTPHETYFKWTYFNWAYDNTRRKKTDFLDLVDAEDKKELAVLKTSDYVTFAWKTYEDYYRRYIYDGDNILSNPRGGWSGCEHRSKMAVFKLPPRILFLGGLGRFFNNMPLLSRLVSNLPYLIDVYGGDRRPSEEYQIGYKGRIENVEEIIDRYQFGINTVSSEILRRNAFSSKIFTYLSYGLPVLFCEWEKFPHELNGCIPYTEDNICEVIESYYDHDAWERLSEDAYAQAQDLLWDKVLEPLLDVI